jgi:hypothetical protein
MNVVLKRLSSAKKLVIRSQIEYGSVKKAAARMGQIIQGQAGERLEW